MSPIMCVSRGPHISTMAFRSGASTFVEGASSNPAVAARAIDFAGLDGDAGNCADRLFDLIADGKHLVQVVAE